MKKLLFVFNPHSGKGLISQHLLAVCDIFTKGGYDVTVHPTQKRLDGSDYIKLHANEYDTIVCSGGDGTLNESITALMELGSDKPLGYIPAGTMNDFASTLGIPKDMPSAARVIINHYPVKVDVGAFNNKYFTYVAAFGIFTSVSYGTDQQLKNSLGVLAYVVEAIRAQHEVTNVYHMRVRYDGGEIEDDFLFGMIANSLSVGGIRGLAGSDVWLDDGIFEGLLIKRPKNFFEINQIITLLLKHDFNPEYFYYFKTSKCEFISADLVPWTVDGEFGGNVRTAMIENNNRVITILAGKNTVTGGSF